MSAINLMSDTQTKPTAGMRRAIADAEVGDEQSGLDPTVNRLCTRVAELLGYEDALFVPSGTMCNQIGILVSCSAGDEIICDASSHIVNTEGAGAAALAGVAIRAIHTSTGIFSADDTQKAVRPNTRTGPRSRMVVAEQTANFLGGRVWSVEQLSQLTSVARQNGLCTHLDGARLFNATVASGSSPADFCAGFDSSWIDLSKGLGCPVGAVLCGTKSFIEEAWRWKYRLGGAMRQAGVLAAAGIYALDHHIERLADDHARARAIAEALAAGDPQLVDSGQVETNIVLLKTRHLNIAATTFAQLCKERGVLLSVIGEHDLKLITHLDITDDDAGKAANIVSEVADNAVRRQGSAR